MVKNKHFSTILYIFILVLLLVNVFLILFYPNVVINNYTYSDNSTYSNIKTASVDDVNYNFIDDIFIENNTVSLSDSYNIQNEYNITNKYNGTYDFNNETIGSHPTGWSVNEAGGNLDIIADDFHYKVLFYDDTSSSNSIIAQENLYNIQAGTIEFWMKASTNSQNIIHFKVMEGATILFYVRMYGTGYIQARGDSGDTNLQTYVANRWYHFKIVFSCTTDKFTPYIDGKAYSEFNFYNNGDNANLIFTETGATATGDVWIDAIGMNDGNNNYDYVVGSNLMPYQYSTGNNQIQYFTYGYDDEGNIIPVEQSLYYDGWTEIDPTGNVATYRVSVPIPEDPYDNDVLIKLPDTQIHGLEKTDFNIATGHSFNCTINIMALVIINSGTSYYFDVYTYDNTLLARLQINYGNTLKYYDGSSYQLLTTLNSDYGSNFQFNLFVSDIVILRCYENYTTHIGNYVFPELTTKEGLGKIKLWGQMPDDSPDCYFYLDDIGYFDNGLSLINTFYSLQYNMYNKSTDKMYRNSNNLVSYKVIGNTSIALTSSIPYYTYNISTLNEFNNETKIFNLWSSTFPFGTHPDKYLYQPTLSLISNSSVLPILTWFKINGVYLNASGNIIRPTYNDLNVDINDNYFYAYNSRLYYTLTTKLNDSEYISALFNMANQECLNYVLNFQHKKNNGYLYSEFRTYYTDNSFTPYNALTTNLYTVNVILPQNKILDKFYFLITDNSELYNGTNTGYYTDIILYFVPDIDITITTLSFLSIIPMLVLLIVVPIIIKSRTRLAFLFIPSVILMAILGMATSIVPYWLGVIIVIFSIMYYFIKKKYGD